MKKIKFVVIGYGHIGKRHSEMIIRNKNSELVAIVDIKEKKDLDLPSDIKFFNSIDSLFHSDINFDVVNIATPNGLHYKHSIQSLKFRKHVVIEKPMALNSKDAENIIHESLKSQKNVFTVMQNRYSPPSKWIKKIIDDNILGEIYMVQLNCFWNRDERYYTDDSWHGDKILDGGTLFTQFSHFVDILYWLFGDINEIKSRFNSFNHEKLTDFEDSGIITFNINSGGFGSINFTTSVWNKNFESSMTIIAQNGTIKIGGQYMNEVEYCNIENYKMPKLEKTRPGNDYGSYKGSAQNHDFVIDNVIQVLNNKDKIKTNALEGLKVVEIIERIYKSFKN
tara:strand:+ start:10805 stop:11815 length:1011 start_codon:yes stop_codon:yes gene_type:complete